MIYDLYDLYITHTSFKFGILNVTSSAYLKYVSANSPPEIITPFFFCKTEIYCHYFPLH